MAKKQQKYRVHLYYHSSIDVDVCAADKADAIEKARQIAEQKDTEELILESLIEDDSPDVEELKN